MTSRNDRILGTIRTAVPGAVGVFIAWLIGKIPAVADYISMIDRQLDGMAVTVQGLLTAAVTGLVIAAYYWLVRKVGDKYPEVEKWLLGSAKQPVYFQPADAQVVKQSIPVPDEREAELTAGDSVVLEQSKHEVR